MAHDLEQLSRCRIVVLSSVAQSVVESQRGLHPQFAFAYSQIRKKGKTPVYRPTEIMNNSRGSKRGNALDCRKCGFTT